MQISRVLAHAHLALIGFAVIFATHHAQAQNGLEVDNISLTGNQLTIVVNDPGTGSTSYQLQSSLTWQARGTNTFSQNVVISSQVTLTSTSPTGDRNFYRVLGIVQNTNPDDLDGDGLTLNFEQTGWRLTPTGPLYTSDPTKFDTDGDGFSDGAEFAYGTNPDDVANPGGISKPDLATLPSVQFATSMGPAAEGAGTGVNKDKHLIPLQFSTSYTGTVTYTVNARSTAVLGDDFQTSGSVSVSGGVGSIELTLEDDTEVSGERLIILDLDTSSSGYRRGGRASHVVCLSDNDAYWNGVLRDGTSERNFRLRVHRVAGGATTAAFVAGGADGTSAPSGVGGSQSVGIVPATPMEVSPATGVIDGPDRFRAVSPAMPEGVAGKIAGSADLQRVLTLDATDAAVIGEQLISGSYEDAVTSSDPGKTYLNRTTTGNFVLIKASPEPADVATEFQP